MSDPKVNPTLALAELERFVVDSDDLLELEAHIGRFNIFDALRIEDVEIRHSNFLAWLLNPAESHGQGSLFLKAILMDMLKQAPLEHRPISPVDLDGVDLQDVEIHREWKKNIDLLITCKSPPFVIAIENKIKSGEHGDQLKRYKARVAEDFPNLKSMFVFLTTDASAASEEDWTPYSYEYIHRALSRSLKVSQGAIGGDVRTFIDHYLRLIGSRFMDDAKIDELCRKIYQNHRQALELIFDRAGINSSGITREIADCLRKQPGNWCVLSEAPVWINFVPTSWLPWLKTVKHYETKPDHLLRAFFDCSESRCRWAVDVGPFTDNELRKNVIKRLTQDPKEFGFDLGRRKISDTWTRLVSEWVLRDGELDEIEQTDVIGRVTKLLALQHPKLDGVPNALKPIFAEWEQSHQPT